MSDLVLFYGSVSNGLAMTYKNLSKKVEYGEFKVYARSYFADGWELTSPNHVHKYISDGKLFRVLGNLSKYYLFLRVDVATEESEDFPIIAFHNKLSRLDHIFFYIKVVFNLEAGDIDIPPVIYCELQPSEDSYLDSVLDVTTSEIRVNPNIMEDFVDSLSEETNNTLTDIMDLIIEQHHVVNL